MVQIHDDAPQALARGQVAELDAHALKTDAL